MTISAENAAILERAIARARALIETESSLRYSLPSWKNFQSVIDCRTSIEIVQKTMETYADRPAIGYRKHEIAVDEATGQRVARALPAFETISYRGLWDRIALLAGGMKQKGIRAGDVVSLVGFSTLDHLVAELACHYLAAISVPLAKNVSTQELELIVKDCQSTTLFCNLEQVLLVAESMPRCPAVRTLIIIDVIEEDDVHRQIVDQARAIIAASRPDMEVVAIAALEALGAASERVPPEIPAEGSDPLLTLVYTSGSTGTPKGAMFCERSWHKRWSTLPFAELASLPMVSVVFLPQNHMGGRNAIANSLRLGGIAYLTHQSDMSTLFEDIRIVRPTYIHLVPRLSEMIYQHFQSEVARRGSASSPEQIMNEMRDTFLGNRMMMALTASAPTPPEVLAFVKRCFDIPVVNVFSGTEYGQLFIDGMLNRQNVLDYKLVSVPELGYLDSDKPYPRGELCVNTARAISRYFNNDSATEQLFDDAGFMRTGDIFEQRGPDELVWIDRKNNVLKLAQGEFVNIWKLEAALSSGTRFIKQVYIQGSSQRAYLLAVIVPEMSEFDAASQQPEAIKSIVRAEIRRLAQVHGLQPYETPRDFVVETTPFTRENGLLTSLNKPARPKLKRKYGPVLEQIYQALDARQTSELSNLAQDEKLPVAARVRRAIAAILGLSEAAVDPSQPFRAFGGDSIAATTLCTFIHKQYGVKLSVSSVLGPQTALADIVAEVEAEIEAEIEVELRTGEETRLHSRARTSATTFERIHGADATAIYARHLRLERFLGSGFAPGTAPGDAAAQTTLLTGATGFLGRFLCLALLERAAKTQGKVYCLVRAKSDAQGLSRLADGYRVSSALQQRFLTLAADHLEVFAGDIEKPCFGWTSDRYAQVAHEVDTIVHAAALVNHALAYSQLFEANVLGTVEAIRLSLTGRRKRFNYVSTNSVSLALLGKRQLALESDDTRALGDGWEMRADRHANGYQISKWAGEVLAQDLFDSYGIAANVFRCNLILPPAHSREQINTGDFLARLVCSVVHTGIYPASFYQNEHNRAQHPHLDGFPVDFIAEAIASIAARPSREYAVYHINNVHWDDGMSLDSLMRQLVALGYRLTRIDDHAAWFQEFEQRLRALKGAMQAASSLPIIDQWRTPLAVDKRRRIDASRFRAQVRALRPQGLEDIPHLNDAYFARYIEDLCRLGLITSP